MAEEAKFPDVPGAAELFAWFGFWPNFHDGEVLSAHLDRSGPSYLRVHTSERTDDVDSRGYYLARKHVAVTFILEGISDSELDEFNHQNVLSDLDSDKRSKRLQAGVGALLRAQWHDYGTVSPNRD